MLTLTNFNLPHVVLNFMIGPSEQLDFPYLLTKVFMYYGIKLGTETLSLGKESFGSASINRMLLPRHDLIKLSMVKLKLNKMQDYIGVTIGRYRREKKET